MHATIYLDINCRQELQSTRTELYALLRAAQHSNLGNIERPIWTMID